MHAEPQQGSLTGQRFTIRQKVIRLIGAAFYIFDETGLEVGYCKE